MKRLWAGFVILFAGIFSFAQQKEIEMDPVTLVSSLNAQKISQTGRNIINISGEQFHKLPVHSVDELLRYIPGIEIQSRGPEGSQSDILIRGGTFQQVLVILDGIRLNDPNTGHFSSYIPIAPGEIDYIEILKGASSAIYGPEAVGGVINIVTKTYAGKKMLSPGSNYRISAKGTVGEYGLFNGEAGAFFQKGNISIGGGLISNNSMGQMQRGIRGYFHNNTASISFKQFLNDHWNIAFRTAIDDRDFSAQNFYTSFISDTASEKVKTFWNQFQAGYQKNRHSVMIGAGYKAVNDHYLYNPSSVANDNHSYQFQTLITDNYHVLDHANLVSGIQYRSEWIRSNDRGDHQLDRISAFIIWDQSLHHFTYSPSLRLDHFGNGDAELVPQLNLSFHLDKVQFRASIGKTIRDADFTERYNNYNKSFVAGGSIGNPDLKPERSLSYEVGADIFISPQSISGKESQSQFRLSVTAFRREQHNVIDWVTTPFNEMPRKVNLSPTGVYALAGNIAKVNTAGLETDILYSKHFDRGRQLRASAGVSWLDDATSESVPSFYILSHAKFLANFNLEYSDQYFSFSVNGIYKRRTPQKASAINALINADLFVMNTKLSVLFPGSRFIAFTELDNIFNVETSDLLGTKLPGRWWMAGIGFDLSKK